MRITKIAKYFQVNILKIIVNLLHKFNTLGFISLQETHARFPFHQYKQLIELIDSHYFMKKDQQFGICQIMIILSK